MILMSISDLWFYTILYSMIRVCTYENRSFAWSFFSLAPLLPTANNSLVVYLFLCCFSPFRHLLFSDSRKSKYIPRAVQVELTSICMFQKKHIYLFILWYVRNTTKLTVFSPIKLLYSFLEPYARSMPVYNLIHWHQLAPHKNIFSFISLSPNIVYKITIEKIK